MLQPVCVWIVEDEPQEFAAMRQALLATGAPAECRCELSAETALTAWQAQPDAPDVWVIDHTLPGMSGLALCQTLRSGGVAQPLILLVAPGQEHIAAAGVHVGVNHYLIKDVYGGYLQLLPAAFALALRQQAEEAARAEAEAILHRQAADLRSRNEELDAFAHTVAHDIKSPLAAISGYVGLLQQTGGAAAPQRGVLENMQRLSQKTLDIVDALLLLASTRKEEVTLQPLPMAAIVAEALNRSLGEAAERAALVHLPDHWPDALGYAPWVEEVWVNYLNNALKYGGAPPEITLGATALPDGRARFWVRDNGVGLSADEQRQLFTPFTRLNPQQASGVGLGLSIIKGIMEKLGGEAGVESQTGQGSLFYFILPAVVYPAATSIPA